MPPVNEIENELFTKFEIQKPAPRSVQDTAVILILAALPLISLGLALSGIGPF